jgi:Nif-specific regulatory protein
MKHGIENLIGGSAPMADLSRSIQKAARGGLTVLIQGETGTGKGVVARAIHDLGKQSARPFIAVNCAAIPETLLESELFGYEAGAFTGATRPKKGKFELADGGTIFLDEIGELSLPGQTKLLQVLQEREVERLGSEGRPRRVDVRVIAATNRDLDDMVFEGTFREDLFFRLNVFPVRTPALRERRDDIPALAHHFALQAGVDAGRQVTGVSPDVVAEFRKYSWPGNVRQLQNVVERAIAMGETEEILRQDLPQDLLSIKVPKSSPKVGKFHEILDETARELCIAAFAATDGDCLAAAQLMGLHRSSLYRLIRRHNLDHLLSV